MRLFSAIMFWVLAVVGAFCFIVAGVYFSTDRFVLGFYQATLGILNTINMFVFWNYWRED